MSWDIIKIILPITLTFFIGIGITPIITHFLYKNKMWKKTAGKIDMQGNETPIFNKLNADKETKTPRMGGVVIWFSVLVTISLFWILSKFIPVEIFNKLDFLSRNQTWIPVAAFFIGALVGLLDDWLEIKGMKSISNKTGGLSFKKRLLVAGLIALFVSAWFYFKLDVNSIGIPFFGSMYLGILIIPIFTLVMLVVYSGGVIDGIDGLAGGVFASAFAAYGFVAFSLGQINLAALCFTILGGILAFLWFNIPPARFYMSETGTMALTFTLSIVAFMTDDIVGGVGLFILPIIGSLIVISAVSSVGQIFMKKFFNRKILIAAPLHLHFQALGWPAYKVTMRYWVFASICAFVGIIISLIA